MHIRSFLLLWVMGKIKGLELGCDGAGRGNRTLITSLEGWGNSLYTIPARSYSVWLSPNSQLFVPVVFLRSTGILQVTPFWEGAKYTATKINVQPLGGTQGTGRVPRILIGNPAQIFIFFGISILHTLASPIEKSVRFTHETRDLFNFGFVDESDDLRLCAVRRT